MGTEPRLEDLLARCVVMPQYLYICTVGLSIMIDILPQLPTPSMFLHVHHSVIHYQPKEKTTVLTPFHLAIQVRDIAETRDFYGVKMGLPEGRSDEKWIDWNMFGHQVVTHLNPNRGPSGEVENHCNPVDAHAVPVPHFGVVLRVDQWKPLADRVRTFVDDFIIEPYVRFEGQPGEQHTMFFADPSGNALEFKAFADIESQLFAK